MLSCATYRVVFEAIEPLDLPAYLGSTLRGAFGHAFRAVACPAPSGGDCPIPAQCPYHVIFETSPPEGSQALRTHEEIPRPFVISPLQSSGDRNESRQIFQRGDEVSFELLLVGRAQEFFPYFVVALREVDRIGRARRAVELKRIEALSPSPLQLPDTGEGQGGGAVTAGASVVYQSTDNLVRGSAASITLDDCEWRGLQPAPRELTIEFITQTRLKHEGRFIRRPEFQVLFRRLLGRLSSLARFHCGAALELDFRSLIDESVSIRLVRDDTKWTRWQRYSSRQDRRMEWEGIIGRARYEGDFAPFWKFLKFGEFGHVGHGATFGLGKYRVI
jgi:CRISPR/Cas system endoribonuclease Cas6 (RAMP superfamily)